MKTPIESNFDELRAISLLTRRADDESLGRERLIRFLDTYSGTGTEQGIVESLCARFGLYPYMKLQSSATETWSEAEALAVEYHSPEALAEEGFTFHAMQQKVYQRLLDGQNVILSAPTSFGKSVIVDALVASERWSNLVFVVPTVALIDETRRRLIRFRTTYKVVTHPSETFARRNILIMTQERFLEVRDLPLVDFFMIDEFYKLGGAKGRDSRRSQLNLAWQRLRETRAQYYLIGPNIDHLDERLPPEVRDQLIRTDFKTVQVDVIDRSGISTDDQHEDLYNLVEEIEGSTLVFTGSPKKAESLGIFLGRDGSAAGIAAEVADWLAATYDPDWTIVRALRRGVGVHTGPLPRSIQRIMVRLFNDARIPTMVCTSTLIEGVNTAARNVIIFEKKIDSQLIDFFTFSNIRGRAGRMFRHFVGRVITYMPPPEIGSTTVDIPIETQSELATDAILIQLPEERLDIKGKRRLTDVIQQNILSLETLRANSGIEPTLQIGLANRLALMSLSQVEAVNWSGYPTNDQARAVLRIAFEELLEPIQRRGINFEMLWGRLRNVRANHDNFSQMIDDQMRYRRSGEDRSDVINGVFSFQRNWMGFTIPAMLRAFDSIRSEVFSRRGIAVGNSEVFLRQVEQLFEPIPLIELEEYGLPLPLARKLVGFGLAGDTAAGLLDSLLQLGSDAGVVSRLTTVEQWILDDVLVGLVGPEVHAS